MKWLCAGRQLDLSEPLIMGIVNVTPDSFPMAVVTQERQKRLPTASNFWNKGPIFWISAENQPDRERRK